jgi:hypothetical protein
MQLGREAIARRSRNFDFQDTGLRQLRQLRLLAWLQFQFLDLPLATAATPAIFDGAQAKKSQLSQLARGPFLIFDF